MNQRVITSIDQLDPQELQRLLAVMDHIKAASPDDAPDPFETRELELDLSAFIKAAWHILEPGTPFIPNWHIDLICEYLTAVTNGEIRRLLINMPPRHLKSGTVTIMWPTWEWTTNAALRYIFSSYASGLSIKHSLDRRAIIQSPWYEQRWGHRVQLSSDSNLKSEFTNTRRGAMVATSTGGTVTGKGGDRIIIDDPQNPEEAYSGNERESSIRFFDQTLSSRLDQPDKGAIVIVMQRLHQKDLSGHVLEDGGYTHLKIPTEATERHVVHFPISGKEIIREKGDLLWPERVGPESVAEAKRRLNPIGYAGQHQQDPIPESGGIFPNAWWNFYDHYMVPIVKQHARRTILFLDTAQQKGKLNDYSVSAAWVEVNHKITDEYQPGYYLVDLWREKVSFPELVEAVSDMRKRNGMAKVVIENKAAGISLAQMLQAKRVPVELFNPDKEKEARAHATSGFVKDGLCYIPKSAPWLHEFLVEHSNFPNSEYDDQVDTTSMMLSYFELNKQAGTPMVKFRRNKTKIRTTR
jgi:predicted phage terminase large subunit-like protein